jgi:cytochrome c biogenesis protein CcmG/thiol:disulfide interchange protein DsbE
VTGVATRRGNRVLWILLAAAVAVIISGVAIASRFGTDPSLVNSPLIGQPVPERALPYLEGEGRVNLADLDGQIAVINFWASWCVGCRDEHPALAAAAAAYGDEGVRVLGVNYQDDRGAASGFLDEFGRDFETLWDPDSRTAIDFGVFGIPETFFVDRRGTIVAKISGPADAGLLAATIEAILAGETPDSASTGPVQGTPGG